MNKIFLGNNFKIESSSDFETFFTNSLSGMSDVFLREGEQDFVEGILNKENEIFFGESFSFLFARSKSDLPLYKICDGVFWEFIRMKEGKLHCNYSSNVFGFGHFSRVAHYAEEIAKRLVENKKIPKHSISLSQKAGFYHDIGKLVIKEGILTNPAKLDELEWEEIYRHPQIGAELVSTCSPLIENEIVEAILQHHEDYNGGGYPLGLKGNEINFLAQIIRLADSFDSMTSWRPGKTAIHSLEEATEEIKINPRGQFNPEFTKYISCLKLPYEKFEKRRLEEGN